MGESDFDQLIQAEQQRAQREQHQADAAHADRASVRRRDHDKVTASLTRFADYLASRVAPKPVRLGPKAKYKPSGSRLFFSSPYDSPPAWLIRIDQISTWLLLTDGRQWRYHRDSPDFPPNFNGIEDTAGDWQNHGACSIFGHEATADQPGGSIIVQYGGFGEYERLSIDEYLAKVAVCVMDGRTFD